MAGTLEGELKDYLEGEQRTAFGEIRELYAVLFSHHRKVIAEIGSYGQFAGILDHYLTLLEQIPEPGGAPRFDALSAFGRQLVQLAWDADYYAANRSRSRAWWAHQVLDFVSGMTDDYLNTLAHRLGC
jgi:dGTP triphosphohydrolase